MKTLTQHLCVHLSIILIAKVSKQPKGPLMDE